MLLKNIFTLNLSDIDKIFELWKRIEYTDNIDLLVFELYYISSNIDISINELGKRIENAHLDKEKIMPTLAERMKKIGEQETTLNNKHSILIKQLSLKYGLSEIETDFINSIKEMNKLDAAIEKFATSNSKQVILNVLK